MVHAYWLMVLEFLELEERGHWLERDLEQIVGGTDGRHRYVLGEERGNGPHHAARGTAVSRG